MAAVVGATRGDYRVGIIVQALAGGLWIVLAWWLIDLGARWQAERFSIRLEPGAAGLLILLGLTGIGVVSVAFVLWSRPAGIGGGVLLIAGLILGGYGWGRALVPLEGDLGLLLLRGAHEPAIFLLLGLWMGGLLWNIVAGIRRSAG